MIHKGRFEGKTAVVTGAAQGIGETVARNMAQEGGRVALVDRSEFVNEVCDDLTADGRDVVSYIADLEQYADCANVVAQAHDHLGRIDILINNVGGTIWAKPYDQYEEKQIEAEIRRSLSPTLWCCRAVLPHMIAQESGVIVNVSSVATRGVNRAPYAAAKGGVNAPTASLAWEYASRGIRVLAVAPGGTEAPPRRVQRNPEAPTEQEKIWYQQIVD